MHLFNHHFKGQGNISFTAISLKHNTFVQNNPKYSTKNWNFIGYINNHQFLLIQAPIEPLLQDSEVSSFQFRKKQ